MPAPSQPMPAVDAAALAHLQRRLARADSAPWLHQEVARRMADRLTVIRQAPADWLDWGGFIGGGRAAVAAVWPQARVTVVEPSAELAERSRQALRGRWWTGRRAQAAVWREHQVPDGQAGMVWANMALHQQPDPAATLQQWHRALAVGGFLMFSCLGPDTLAELRALYAERGWPAPHPPFTDMHDIGDWLVQAGFADPVMDQEQLLLNWSSPQALLAELRSIGGNLGHGRFAGLRTPRWQRQLVDGLAGLADGQGRIAMRIEVVYGHAYKAAPRPPRGETTLVSLESLRSSLSGRRQGGAGGV